MASPSKNNLVVVYHADCIDGAASAWIIDKAKGGKDITYIPYDHADHAASENKIRAALQPDTEIYFADLTPKKHFLNELIIAGRNIHILDHHKSAAEMLKDYRAPNLNIHVDAAAASAAGMIWQHFFAAEKAPDVIGLISLMDGSGAGLKTAQDFAAAALVDSKDIGTTERAFDTLRGLAKASFNEMAKKGSGLVADQTAEIDKLLENAPFVQIQILPDTKPVNVPIVNGDVRNFGRQISERLVDLGKKAGANVAFIWSLQKTGAVSLSIRTDGNPDASKIAAHLCKITGATGGGHQDAAAVHFLSLSEFTKHMQIKTTKSFENKQNPPPKIII
jgi:hypothetical protein